MGGLFDNVHSDIADYIVKNVFIVGYSNSKSASQILSEALLPIYQDAVKNQGYPIYQVSSGASASTLSYVTSKSGLPKTVVLQYLSTLEDMAKKGLIDLNVWNPTIPKEQSGIIGDITQSIGSGISSGFNKLLFVSAAVTVLYLLGKAVINKKL